MKRLLVVGGGGYCSGKSEVGRAFIEMARQTGYDIIQIEPGATGRLADRAILDECPPELPQIQRKHVEEVPTPYAPNNRKARRAQAAIRRCKR